MIRIPATLVGLGLTVILGILSLVVASILTYYSLLFVLWPLCTAIGGFVSARLALRVPPVPGLAVGILGVAFQVGLSVAVNYENVLPIVFTLWFPIVQIMTSIIGGVIGAFMASRASKSTTQTEQTTKTVAEARDIA